MKQIGGIGAIKLSSEISKLPDGEFTIAFYPYNRTKGVASDKLRVIEGCKTRTQLPQDIWQVSSDNYFLFQDKDGNPKTCYRVLMRFIGFPQDDFELRKINWFTDE